MQGFMKIKCLRKGEINHLSFTDIGKSCPSRDFLTSQICLLTLFAKIFEFTVLVFCSSLCTEALKGHRQRNNYLQCWLKILDKMRSIRSSRGKYVKIT